MKRNESKKKILFVDDEPKVLNGIRRSLLEFGDRWDMLFETSPIAALKTLQQEHFDVLVTDIAMPKLSGLDLVKQVNKDRPDTCCLVLTGTADLKLAEELINTTSVFRFYTKPCDVDLLSEGIAEALKAQTRKVSPQTSSDGENLEHDVLNKIPTGVLVVNASGHIQFLNQSAANTLSRNTAIGTGENSTLKGQTPSQSKELLTILEQITASTTEETRGLTFDEPETGDRLHFIFSKYKADNVLVFMTDPCETPLPDAKLIRELFGLTTSEANLAERLICGDSVKDAAAKLGLTEHSARTYLKTILSKMSANRQSELISRILATNLPR